jgi:hypothetical protein
MKIFFNCLVHTNNNIVEDMIFNIKKFVDQPIICLHVSKVFEDFDFERFSRIENVYINPDRYNTYKGGTFMPPLCSNINYITNVLKLDYDYQMIFYSQMLFIKKGVENYLKDADGFISLHEYHWESTPAIENPTVRFPKGVVKNLVEGICCSRDVTIKTHDFIINDDHLLNNDGWVPEEVIFPSCILKFSEKIKNYPTCSHAKNFHDIEEVKKFLNREIDSMPHLYFGNQPEEQIFAIHRVDYDYNGSIRKYIREI